MPLKLKILIIEDFEEDANLMKFHLSEGGIEFQDKIVATKEELEEALDNFFPDVVLCDHTLPQFDSVRALKVLNKRKRNIPFILVTGSVSEEFAVQMIQAGASDYIIKDRMTRLPSAVRNAIQKCNTENERKKYFEEVIANEKLFKKAEKLAHFGVWSIDFITDTITWSDEIYKILGYEIGEVKPSEENFLKSVHPDEREPVKKIIADTLINKDSLKFQYRVLDKTGTLRHVESEFLIERDENLKPLRLTGFSKDITEQQKAEQELLKSLKETSDYKYALDESSIVAITDQKGIIKHANDNFCKISGYSREELIGQDHRIISSGYHTKEFIKNLWVTIANGKIWKGELKNKAKDGTIYWVDTTIVPFLNNDGKPYQYIAIRTDITSRKLIKENLQKSEYKFRQFFEAAPEAILILDIQKKIFVDFNDNALKLLKKKPEELMNASPLSVTAEIQPEGISSLEKMTGNIDRITAGEKLTSEWLIVDSEGKQIFCEIRSSLLSDYDKNLMRLSIIDITDRKNAEFERNRITEDLFKRNKNLEEFAYIISHNLRAPVANILGFSEELSASDYTEAEKAFLLSELRNAVERLDSVIIDLNDILQINNKIEENRESVFFSTIVHDIKIQIKNLIENNEVEIITNFSDAPKILTVKSYLYSIFFNLISNSIKYKQPGIKTVIEISSYKKDGKLILVFKDNGMGIDLEKKKKQVFGLYKRFHPDIEGKGVGLFMVKSQVAALDGNINISSEINKGTIFTIELKL